MAAALQAIDNEKSAEFLRLAVAAMARHRVPTTPQNYATWYAHVSGENPELSAELKRLATEPRAFSEAVCEQLHRKYIAGQDASRIDQVRASLHGILGEVSEALATAGSNAEDYQGKIGGLVDNAKRPDGMQDIRQLLETLIAETRSMQDTTSEMQSQFVSKSKEIEELQQQLQKERERAITDPLTGLYNRFALLDHLDSASRGAKNDGPLSLVMLDIDHFKAINDTHGHLIGDRVIRFVAQAMKRNIKGQDMAARYGGEEFTLLLPSTPTAGARAVAENVRKAIASAQLVRADTKQPLGQITVSLGVATYRANEDVMEFVNRADKALYRSKNDGRNRVSVATG
jgi:diguanylate cyclase